MQNRNPLIEDNTEETLLNIHSVLLFLQHQKPSSEPNKIPNDQINQIGLSLILKCTNEALFYEIDRLEKDEQVVGNTAVFEA